MTYNINTDKIDETKGKTIDETIGKQINNTIEINKNNISKLTESKEGLSEEGLQKIISSVILKVKENGADYYGWKNSPEISENGEFIQEQGWGENAKKVEISKEDAKKIYDEKLNGAYGERFVMSLGMVSSLMKNGYNIRFVQFQEEKGLPFDANGWTVMIIEGMPMFHISPDDLDAEGLGKYVEVLDDNNAPDVSWKQTNKVGEFEALLKGSMESGLDLVKIAQEGSK